MIITCEQCLARFRLADDKLKPGGTRVRCSKCQNIFTVMPPLATAPAELASAAGETAAPPPPDQPEAAAPLRETAASPDASHGPVEFDFGFGEPDTPHPAASDEAPESPSLPAAEAMPSPPDSADSSNEFRFTPPLPEVLPDTAPEDWTGTIVATSTSEAVAGFATSAAADDDSPISDFAEGTDEDEDQFVFSAETEAEEPSEPVDSFGFGLAVDARTGAATEEFNFVGVDDDHVDAGFAGGTDEDTDQFVFAEEPETVEATEAPTLDQTVSEEPSPFDISSVFGEEEELAWDQPTEAEAFKFDFDEPDFAAASNTQGPSRSEEGGLGFGEINFGEQAPEFTPAPAPTPAASPVTLPPAPTAPPTPTAPRPSVRPAHAEEPVPPPASPRKGPLTRLLLLLALLLLLLCGAAGYFYFAAEGQQFAEQLMLKLKGEEAAPVLEQRIGLSIADSSYVDNREVGQLLVIQGATTNNFGAVRSAITVKGVLLNADGKVLQQQTVFGGNYLSEEKLRESPYAQIEEAMNNQFGDSLTNMNVKPGATIRFTIVFRNPPHDLAGINVEVVDSKPGGL
jgi:predicted Zn finger-like uncharacterized protein